MNKGINEDFKGELLNFQDKLIKLKNSLDNFYDEFDEVECHFQGLIEIMEIIRCFFSKEKNKDFKECIKCVPKEICENIRRKNEEN